MDRKIFRWINGLTQHTSWANGAVKSYAKYGIGVFALLLLAAFIDSRRLGDLRAVGAAVWAGAAALVALGFGQLIGGAVDRARPYESLANVHVLISRTTDFSFPSDHATAAGAVAVGLLWCNRRWGTSAAVAAILMAFARVYAGAHYPSDVLAGLLLGAVVAGVIGYVVVGPLHKLIEHLASGPIRPLLTRAALPQRP